MLVAALVMHGSPLTGRPPLVLAASDLYQILLVAYLWLGPKLTAFSLSRHAELPHTPPSYRPGPNLTGNDLILVGPRPSGARRWSGGGRGVHP